MKKYKVIVLDKYGNEQPLSVNKNKKMPLEIMFKSEKSKICFYENLKQKYPKHSIKMMMCS